jgi:YfiH family protein
VTILRARVLADAGVLHGFPTRNAGEVAPRVIQVKQVHGARAVEATGAEGVEADALVARAADGSTSPVCAVGVRVADCVPLLVADEASGDVAAIHAGWRGVVAGVVKAGVELLGGERLVAAIGPCIGSCCFEVGRDVGERIGFVVREEGAKVYVDLRAAVRAQLRALGVDDARIEDVPGCTKHEPARFHSFRRDGANSGRMLATIAARVRP